MLWIQKRLRLPAVRRGFHLITDLLTAELPELEQMEMGTAHFFIQHTSASLTINENADPTVRRDMEEYFNRVAPENAAYFQHTQEGPDDMPAHLKAVLLGSSVTVPVMRGELALGTWQGIYLGEHRNHGGRRWVVATLMGKKAEK
ncbi:secondary thiamine-phosphate synthase enzyme YjbQ [Hymenobacter aerilatus]|uniref:Secondary thiamine-phosphate synthase enzyme YjbQ n=1 Tax=Hymenobacter aerilatus TaxID=2932251 RepID=A0A8T9SY48_9BACT|nr:secondary thiamine-phosphate synthase enzyme YjbQ [Hymenobacter aerilatus]UOR04709.1 secondary thiamine-phosphate synthase enzyme YjbQ [Hymenobacter aerilatus]